MKPAHLQRTGRLLIVDDDEGVRRLFAGILRLQGHEVRTASTADEGLREVGMFRPDGMLLDLRMPLVNGFGLLYRLRENPVHRDLPVAIVTGDCSLDDDLLSELRELGAEVRHKPLGMEDLIVLADTLLAKKKLTPHQQASPPPARSRDIAVIGPPRTP
jgi:DNA-binding response OmpR family regulator